MRKFTGTNRDPHSGPGLFAHPSPGNLSDRRGLTLVPTVLFAESRRVRAQAQFDRAQQSGRLGRVDEALESLKKAVALDSSLVDGHLLIAKIHADRKETLAAKAACIEALRHWPLGRRPEVGVALMCCDCPSPEDRQIAARHLIGALQTPGLTAHELRVIGFGLANTQHDQKAVEAFTRSLQIEPDVSALTELATCHIKLRNPVAAEEAFRAAIRLDPSAAAPHANLGLLLLLMGDYPQGFREFEWRTQLANFPLFYHFEGFAAPRWTGESLAGKTILLHTEQGFGDTIQFMRYVPHVAALGATVVVAVQPGLETLLQHYPGVHQCVSNGGSIQALDFHCPLMSLPVVFGTTRHTVPPLVPLPCPDLPLLSTDGTPRPLRVGLVWAGNPNHPTDSIRSLHLADLAPLAAALDAGPNAVEFISLQHGPATAQLQQNPLPFPIEDACSRVADFSQTAAIVATLDLVIAVDTSVAHLAATMQRPVWLFLGSVPEWRWGFADDTTPWYPTLRIFRATTPEARPETVARIANALAIAAAAFRQLQLAPPGE